MEIVLGTYFPHKNLVGSMYMRAKEIQQRIKLIDKIPLFAQPR